MDLSWSIAQPSDWISVQPVPHSSGGLLCLTETALAVYGSDGELRWETSVDGRQSGKPRFGPDGSILLIEDANVTARSTETGAVRYRFPVHRAVGLSVAPWGDLLYLRSDRGGPVVAHCVGSEGQARWSAPLEGTKVFGSGFLPVGDVVVVGQHGVVWAFDRDGHTPWIADPQGVRSPRPEDRARRQSDFPESGIRITGAITEGAGAGQLLLELESYRQRGLYLLDSRVPEIREISVPSRPMKAPYIVVPWQHSGRIIGYGEQVELEPGSYGSAIRAIEWDGSPAWTHLCNAAPIGLTAGPGGSVLVSVSPTVQYWADYHRFGDLRSVTYVQCLAPDGSLRWQWHPPGPITRTPITGPDGTIYVGSEGRLWALAADGG